MILTEVGDPAIQCSVHMKTAPRVTGREPITSHRLNSGCRRVRE